MANNPQEASSSDDFLDHLLGLANPSFPPPNSSLTAPDVLPPPHVLLQLGSADDITTLAAPAAATHAGAGSHGTMFPLGLSLEQGSGGLLKPEDASSSGKRFPGEVVHIRPPQPQANYVFHNLPVPNTVHSAPHPPVARPRVRARRGQATDPHSIAERLRRERIAERIRALQDLVPSVNKTDRAVMLDEILDYVKFLRLQVKVLSMSRIGGGGAVAPLLTDVPVPSFEEEGSEGINQPAWEKWSSDGTEQQVAKLMEENVGAAMQFLQSKALCIMPISVASAIYHAQPPDSSSIVKPETNPP